MSPSLRLLFHLAWTALFLGSQVRADSASGIDSGAVDALIKETLKTWHVPGAAVVIVRDDRVVYLKGHGVKELGKDQAVTPETVFPLASCTKGFTTAAMALLVDEGKMHWDDPVRKHLEYFRLADPLADANATLRDLVTHRTGLRGHDLLWYRAAWKPEEAVRRIGYLPLDYSFRSRFQYQSTMFTAAGLAVGATAQTTWADFVQKRLLNPLGMTATTFTTTAAEKAADRSSPHRRNLEGKVFVVPWYPLTNPDPAGSINSTARDMGNWLRFQLGAGTFADKRLVSPEALRETHTPQFALRLDGGTKASNPETNLMSYGMGWLIHDFRGRLLVSHAGFIDGFRVQITLVPKEKLGFVLLYNLQELRMNLALSNSLVDLLLGLPKKDWNAYIGELAQKETEEAKARIKERWAKRHPRAPASHEPDAYTGTFEHSAYGTARITFENVQLVRRLMLRWSNFEWSLEHFHFDTFMALDDNVGNPFVTFIFGADGKAAGIQVGDPLGVVFQKEPDKNK